MQHISTSTASYWEIYYYTKHEIVSLISGLLNYSLVWKSWRLFSGGGGLHFVLDTLLINVKWDLEPNEIELIWIFFRMRNLVYLICIHNKNFVQSEFEMYSTLMMRTVLQESLNSIFCWSHDFVISYSWLAVLDLFWIFFVCRNILSRCAIQILLCRVTCFGVCIFIHDKWNTTQKDVVCHLDHRWS